MGLVNRKYFRIMNSFLLLILILTVILTGCNKRENNFTNNVIRDKNVNSENRLPKKIDKDKKDELENIKTELKEINKKIDRMKKEITSKKGNLGEDAINNENIKNLIEQYEKEAKTMEEISDKLNKEIEKILNSKE
ncbi:hypothetical protein [Caloranaerobacter sp. DY30410]|uniref:hypothetical protein n=1 Tax=Caloranaerobacter sp. DY30410 TaxID=3238305 RepID=UPI003D05249B